MIQTIKKLIVWMLVSIILFGGWKLHNNNQTIEHLENERKQNVSTYLHSQSNWARSLDSTIAEMIVAPTEKQRDKTLSSALQTINLIGHQSRFYRDQYYIYHNMYPYQSFLRISEKYLLYLQERQKPLNEIEIENLIRMGNISRIAADHLERMFEDSFKMTWDEIAYGNAFHRDFEQLIHDISQIPHVGQNDPTYHTYLENRSKHIGKRTPPFHGEERLLDDQLTEIAKEFMGELWSNPEHQKITSYGGQHGPDFGERRTFGVSTNENRTSSSYQVEVSTLGGHIISVWSEEEYGTKNDMVKGPLTKEEAIRFAEDMIERWNEEPLTLLKIQDHGDSYWLTYVPVRNDVPLANLEVSLNIDYTKGRLLRFEARSYFSGYRNVPNLEPVLTGEDAISQLPSHIDVVGIPQLEVRYGNSGSNLLVYAIPVSGMERLKHVYINALNGKYEGINYDYGY